MTPVNTSQANANADANPELPNKLKKYRLSPAEYELICQRLGRQPQGVEWALFSSLWSEHCSYKSSRVHLKKLFNQSSRVLQSSGENAGIIDLGEGERIAFKMESHNHPSFIEPTQGAATGVGGILRDIFTMGARPIAVADYLCFGAPPDAPRFQSLLDGVVRGIGGYGNCVGVPNITGQTEFDKSYNNNILVNAMAVGLLRPGEPVALSRAEGVGNWIVYVGAKTGRDGIHGAAMASESFAGQAQASAQRPTVQIGDPFYEKLLIESCLEVIQKNLVVAIQDMGAAGLTSSSFEMAEKGNVGFDIDLSLVPLRDPTLTPEDILLSESQERMLLICQPEKFPALAAVFHRWNLDAVRIGEVKAERRVRLFWQGDVICDIDPQLVVEGPQVERPYKEISEEDETAENKLQQQSHPRSLALSVSKPIELIKSILSDVRGNSRAWIYRQYDNRVGAMTARDCTESVGVLRLPDSGRALGVVLGCRPSVMRWRAAEGGVDAIAFPALELAAKGFEALAVTDCLNYGNPEKIEIMSEFVASLNGLNQMCRDLSVPIISGNVSFYNETQGVNITSTPATGLVGLWEKGVNDVPWSHFKSQSQSESEDIVLLGLPLAAFGGMAEEMLLSQKSSSSAAQGFGRLKPNTQALAQFVQAVRDLVRQSLPTSTRVVGKFGLGYSLIRMALPQGVGFTVHNEVLKARVDQIATGLSLDSLNGLSLNDSLFVESFYEVILTFASSAHRQQAEAIWKNLISSSSNNSYFLHLGHTHCSSSQKMEKDQIQIGDLIKFSTVSEVQKIYGAI